MAAPPSTAGGGGRDGSPSLLLPCSPLPPPPGLSVDGTAWRCAGHRERKIFCSPPFREPAACMHGRVHVPPPPPPSCATMGGRLARRPDDHPVGTKSGGAVSDVEGGGNGEWRTTTNSRAQNLGWGERKAADQPACPRCASTANIPTILEPTMRQPPGIRRRASRRLTALSPHQHQSVLCQAPPHQHGWPLRRAPYFFPPIESAPR